MHKLGILYQIHLILILFTEICKEKWGNIYLEHIEKHLRFCSCPHTAVEKDARILNGKNHFTVILETKHMI